MIRQESLDNPERDSYGTRLPIDRSIDPDLLGERVSIEAVIIDAVRTPVGRFGGGLSSVRPDDLGAIVIRELLDRTAAAESDVDEVIFGCANQSGEDSRNVARMSVLLSGLPVEVPAVTVNRLCASGLEAIGAAARRIMSGEADVCIAGGVESMSRAVWVLRKPERKHPRGNAELEDTTVGWRCINPRMAEMHGVDSMGETAENVADRFQISRRAQDEFALASHRKAVQAQDAGAFEQEIVPVRVGEELVATDESPRRGTSMASLERLRPAFKEGGSVTAGNSSSLNDGAAALLVTSREYAEQHGLTPKLRIATSAAAGVPPRIMGIGPVPATKRALDRLGLTLRDFDRIELNEAFASQALAVIQEWGIAADDARLNCNGGAIAIGHPLGCSGARIVTSLLGEFQRDLTAQRALVTMCVGVGQGHALVLERA